MDGSTPQLQLTGSVSEKNDNTFRTRDNWRWEARLLSQRKIVKASFLHLPIHLIPNLTYLKQNWCKNKIFNVNFRDHAQKQYTIIVQWNWFRLDLNPYLTRKTQLYMLNMNEANSLKMDQLIKAWSPPPYSSNIQNLPSTKQRWKVITISTN